MTIKNALVKNQNDMIIIRLLVLTLSVAMCLCYFNLSTPQLIGLSFVVAIFMEFFLTIINNLEHMHKLWKQNLEYDENGEDTEEEENTESNGNI